MITYAKVYERTGDAEYQEELIGNVMLRYTGKCIDIRF